MKFIFFDNEEWLLARVLTDCKEQGFRQKMLNILAYIKFFFLQSVEKINYLEVCKIIRDFVYVALRWMWILRRKPFYFIVTICRLYPFGLQNM